MQPSDFAACCLIFIDAVLSVLLYCKCCGAKKRCERRRFFIPVMPASFFGGSSHAAEGNSGYSTYNFDRFRSYRTVIALSAPVK